MSDSVEVSKIIPAGSVGPTEEGGHAAYFRREVRKLMPDLDDVASMAEVVMRKGVVESEPTNSPTAAGTKGLPFNFDAAIRLKLHNVHHAACVETKKQALVGLGHVDGSKADEVLDPLCTKTWAILRAKLAEDYANVGNAYMEVVRSGPTSTSSIVGLHHVPAADVRVVVETNLVDHHFEIRGGKIETLMASSNSTVMAPFGQLGEFRARNKLAPDRKISEIIDLPDPSSLSREYGVPMWLASVADMELSQAVRQHQFDFHVNRGVPEFLLFLLGGRVDKKTWEAIESAMQAYVGVGNSHKSSAFNLIDPQTKVQLEQLHSNEVIKGDFYTKMTEALATTIVTAHRVPPILAGILIPGKLGAANELPNAIMAFQTLVIGPWQKYWTSILGATLGGPLNGDLGLKPKDFEWKSIVDAMAEGLAKLAPAPGGGASGAVSGMRQTLPEAAAEGRDLNSGVKKSTATRIAEALGQALAGADE